MPEKTKTLDYRELAVDLVKKAHRAGAFQAEVYLETGKEFKVTVRDKKIDFLSQSGLKRLGLRVFVADRMGLTYTSDFSAQALTEFIQKAVFLAKNSTTSPYNGLPEDFADYSNLPDLRIYDEQFPHLNPKAKISLAERMETAARDYSKLITNSDGSEYREEMKELIISNSKIENLTFKQTTFFLACAPIAQKAFEKKVAYEWDVRRFFLELEYPEKLARKAAEKAVRSLGAKKIKSQKVPVVLNPETASSFLSAVAAACDGNSVYEKTSFLTDKLEQEIGSEMVNIRDDGRMISGLGSRPFDSEGVPTTQKKIVDKGVLRGFLYDSFSSRKAKTKSTGNASRSYNSPPAVAPSNFYLVNGDTSPEEIIKSVKNGFYVTNLMGFGLNPTSGDFSRMAEGFWIENGKLTFPVHQVTIAGNILDLLQNVEALGNDLQFKENIASPTIKVASLTVSGK